MISCQVTSKLCEQFSRFKIAGYFSDRPCPHVHMKYEMEKNTKLPMKYIHESSCGGVPPKDIRETLLLIHLKRNECIVL